MTRPLACMLTLLSLLGLAGLAPARAEVPLSINYQSQVLDAAGRPLAGPADIDIGIWSAAEGGVELYHELHRGVALADGVANVLIGKGNRTRGEFGAATFAGRERWLEVAINGTTLAPRQLFAAVAYALQAAEAERVALADGVDARNAAGESRALMIVLPSGAGFLTTRGANGSDNVRISSLATNANHGAVSVHDAGGAERVLMLVLASGAGSVVARGPNGNDNVRLTSLGANANHGFVSVHGANGSEQAAMFVNTLGQGQIVADVKNFVAAHPDRPDARIVYTSLEGPEAAIYCRGVARLAGGQGSIELPEHFRALANPDTITVQLTPASLGSRGLAFERLQDGRIAIGELNGGRGSYAVHFLVHAVRRGYEHQQPVVGAGELQALYGRRGTGSSTLP